MNIWLVIFLAVIFASAVPVMSGMLSKGHSQAVMREHDEALNAMRRGEVLPYGKIRRLAEKSLQGHMVGERLRRTNRGWVYEVRVRKKDGMVVFAVLDAKTGQVLTKRAGKGQP